MALITFNFGDLTDQTAHSTGCPADDDHFAFLGLADVQKSEIGRVSANRCIVTFTLQETSDFDCSS
jgi:hypothetical protein